MTEEELKAAIKNILDEIKLLRMKTDKLLERLPKLETKVENLEKNKALMDRFVLAIMVAITLIIVKTFFGV